MGNALFHLLAAMFQEDVVFFEPRPLDTIKNLRSSGLSLTEIAAQTGTPATVVRRLVEKTDWAKIKRQHEEVAVRIDREEIGNAEKLARWAAETGKSSATYWRALRRVKAQKP